MGRKSLTILMLLVAVAAGWLLYAPGGEAEPGPAGRLPLDPVPGLHLPSTSGAPAPPPAPALPEVPVETTPFRDTEAEAAPVVPPGGPMLRVLELDSGEPVPFATVRFIEIGSVSQEAVVEVVGLRPSAPEIFTRHGLRIVADENGEARLPPYHGGALATGEAPGLFGLSGLPDPDSGPLKLELRPDQDVVVLVVDAAGRPATGVPVALEPRKRSKELPFWTGITTSAEGTVRMAHAPWLFDDAARGARELAIRPRIPVADPPEVLLRRTALPEEPVRLALPATGSVAVSLRGPEGAAAPPDACVTVGRWLPPDGDRRTPAPEPPPARVRTADGRAVFPHVGLGLELEVTALTLDQRYRPVTVRQRGPVEAGEEVRITLTFGERLPAISARAIDEDGEPYVRRRVAARLTSFGDATLALATTVTDDDGRFTFVINPASENAGLRPPETPHLQVNVAAAARRLPDQNSPRADLGLPGGLAPGETDLGDVTFFLPPLVAAGVVVDPEGQPIKSVALGVEQMRARGPTDRWPTWLRLWHLGAQTDSHGAFEIRGDCEAAEVRGLAELDGWYESDRPSFRPGVQGLRIVLGRAGQLEGSVLVPPGLPPPRVHVGVHGAPAATFTSGSKPADVQQAQTTMAVDRDGRFRFPRLRPGIGEVVVRIGWSGEPLITIPGVAVAAGEANLDPRLQGIDLRQRVKAIALTLVDGTGRPVEAAEVEMSGPGARGPSENSISDEGGRALLVTTRPAVDVVIRAKGFRDTLLEGVAADRQIVLQDAIPVRLILTGSWPLPEPPYSVTVCLLPAGEREGARPPRSPRHPSPETVGLSRDVRISVPAPGPHRVTISLVRTTESKTSSHPLRGLESEVIDVLDSSQEQVFQIPLSEARLLGAFEALRR